MLHPGGESPGNCGREGTDKQVGRSLQREIRFENESETKGGWASNPGTAIRDAIVGARHPVTGGANLVLQEGRSKESGQVQVSFMIRVGIIIKI